MLQPPQGVTLTLLRFFRKKYKWSEGGIKYPGFTYYPRRPDFQEEPCEPAKLFRVQRIKPVRGTPYWERNILKELGLVDRASDVQIVKNMPETNSKLWKIKHLIKIEPVTFPNGFPAEDDHTLLKENGELVVKHMRLSDERAKALEDFKSDTKRLDGDTLRRQSRKTWLDGW